MDQANALFKLVTHHERLWSHSRSGNMATSQQPPAPTIRANIVTVEQRHSKGKLCSEHVACWAVVPLRLY